MGPREIQQRLEAIITALEAAKDMETKYEVHKAMARQGRAFITGFREDFAEELDALDQAYQQSLALQSRLSQD